jgi:acyl-CoA synthetase (AMP-forming)/AMP-acid ligase II
VDVLAAHQSAATQAANQIPLAALFRRSARVFRNRVAVWSSESQYTYGELDERTNRLAQAITARGIRQGDRVAVLSTTRPEYVELYVAAAKLGITVVALNIRLAVEDFGYCTELTQPRMLFASPGFVEAAGAIASAAPDLEETIVYPDVPGDAASDYEEMLRGAPPVQPDVVCDPEAIHCVLFTSGTTGRPKGAMISQRASATRAFRVAHTFGLTEEDGLIAWIPMYHTGGDECLQATLMTGGTFATFERLDIPAIYRAIEALQLSWSPMLPGVITEFLHHPDRERHDLTSFRFGLGYANMMPQVVEEFTSTFDADFWDCFGQTESSFVLALDRIPPGVKPPLRKRPTELLDIRLVDEDMNEVPAGTPGECVVRGPSVMSGYIGNPSATDDVFRGGWLHTGDVLTGHEDGTYTYVDRLSYMIKTGGENVYPAEVESVLTSHPAVQESCVLAVPHERWGEAIKAVVVLGDGATVTKAELGAWCRDRLVGFKRPRFVEFVPNELVPRSVTGKILRHKLAEQPVSEDQRI